MAGAGRPAVLALLELLASLDGERRVALRRDRTSELLVQCRAVFGAVLPHPHIHTHTSQWHFIADPVGCLYVLGVEALGEVLLLFDGHDTGDDHFIHLLRIDDRLHVLSRSQNLMPGDQPSAQLRVVVENPQDYAVVVDDRLLATVEFTQEAPQSQSPAIDEDAFRGRLVRKDVPAEDLHEGDRAFFERADKAEREDGGAGEEERKPD